MTMACVFSCRGKLYINQDLSPHFSLGVSLCVSPTLTHARTHTPVVDTAEAQRCRGWVRAERPAAMFLFSLPSDKLHFAGLSTGALPGFSFEEVILLPPARPTGL